MIDDIERMAEAIHMERPVSIDGQRLDWASIVRLHPDRATMYREAANNRIGAAETMKRMDAEVNMRRPPSKI